MPAASLDDVGRWPEQYIYAVEADEVDRSEGMNDFLGNGLVPELAFAKILRRWRRLRIPYRYVDLLLAADELDSLPNFDFATHLCEERLDSIPRESDSCSSCGPGQPRSGVNHVSRFRCPSRHSPINVTAKNQEFYQLLDKDGITDDIHLFNEKLREWEDYYNYHRPHGALDGQTPYERLVAKMRAGTSPAS